MAGNAIVIPRLDPGRDVLLGAAIVTGVAMVLGAAAAGYVVWRRLGAFLPILSIVRVIAAIAVAMGVGYVVPFRSPLMTLVEAALVGLTFLAVLVVTGELGKADLQSIIAVRKKRGTGGDA